jgi:hypothetical protein
MKKHETSGDYLDMLEKKMLERRKIRQGQGSQKVQQQQRTPAKVVPQPGEGRRKRKSGEAVPQLSAIASKLVAMAGYGDGGKSVPQQQQQQDSSSQPRSKSRRVATSDVELINISEEEDSGDESDLEELDKSIGKLTGRKYNEALERLGIRRVTPDAKKKKNLERCPADVETITLDDDDDDQEDRDRSEEDVKEEDEDGEVY